MTADQLTLNQSGKIVEISASPLKINLMELGFLPGKQLTLQHKAPSDGPMAFQLEEMEDESGIQVESAEKTGGSIK